MRVLVTGTDGYIGILLGPKLVERGHDVVGLETGFYRDGWLYNNGVTRLPPSICKDLRHITEDGLSGFERSPFFSEDVRGVKEARPEWSERRVCEALRVSRSQQQAIGAASFTSTNGNTDNPYPPGAPGRHPSIILDMGKPRTEGFVGEDTVLTLGRKMSGAR